MPLRDEPCRGNKTYHDSGTIIEGNFLGFCCASTSYILYSGFFLLIFDPWKFPPRNRTPATCWAHELWDQSGLSAPDWPHLDLVDSSKANSSIIQVLQALQRMPALTYLCLVDSIRTTRKAHLLTLSSTFPAFGNLAFHLVSVHWLLFCITSPSPVESYWN